MRSGNIQFSECGKLLLLPPRPVCLLFPEGGNVHEPKCSPDFAICWVQTDGIAADWVLKTEALIKTEVPPWLGSQENEPLLNPVMNVAMLFMSTDLSGVTNLFFLLAIYCVEHMTYFLLAHSKANMMGQHSQDMISDQQDVCVMCRLSCVEFHYWAELPV